jgi:hypothetical protein
VWLPDELYEVRTPLGDELIGIRTTLLSAKRVRDAYLGYATQQFKRLYDRGDSSLSADTRKRTAKHARHLRRLCHQGFELYATGRVSIRVENPEEYHRFGEQVAADAMAALPLLKRYEAAFDETRSALPEQPDEAPVEAWLRRVRAHYYTPASTTNSTPLAAGAWVFAGGLHGPETATVLRPKDGDVLITDGPYAEGKEYLGGLCLIKAPDLDAALEWGRKATGRPRCPSRCGPS